MDEHRHKILVTLVIFMAISKVKNIKTLSIKLIGIIFWPWCQVKVVKW
jgi:hypothetical protein